MASMMKLLCVHVVFLFAIIHCSNSSKNATEPLDSERCYKLCENSFSVHTYPEPDDLKYCKSGCRFYKLNEFNNENFEEVLHFCEKVCMSKTSVVSQQRACNVGCEMQGNIRKEGNANNTRTIHILSPLYSIRFTKLILDSFYNAFRAIQTTYSYYMADNGAVVAVRSSSQYLVPLHRIEGSEEAASSNVKTYSGNSKTGNVEDVESPSSPSNDWLGCVSRKSGLPRSFIAFSIILAVVAFVWICMSTSSERHQNSEVYLKEKMPTVVNLDEYSEKVKIQPCSDDQAPPIPVKINLTSI